MSLSNETYLKIGQIIENYKSSNLNKISVYGILTFLCVNPKTTRCTPITIVDESCDKNDKLKCLVFSTDKDKDKLINHICQPGDIVRLRHIKIQDYNNQAQGCVNATFSTWIRFKRSDNGFSFEGNNPNSTIDDYDKLRVKQLRDWLKTNPINAALFEANLSQPRSEQHELNDSYTITDQDLEQAALKMTMQENTFRNLKLVNFSQLQKESYFDLVCQVLAICDSKCIKFLLVWDSTKSNFAIHQENEFKIETTLASTATSAALSDYKNKILYSSKLSDCIFQVFVFDEFLSQLDLLEPGDFVLLKNAKSCAAPSNSTSDILLKMPGVGNNQLKYGRALIKLASYSQLENTTFDGTQNKEIDSLINDLYEKGKILDLKFHTEQEFRQEYLKGFDNLNDTFADLISENKQKDLGTQKAYLLSLLSRVNNLMEDDSKMYITDDEESSSNSKKQTESHQNDQTIELNNICNSIATKLESPAKKAKIIDPYEISEDIFKLKKLTHIIPFLNSNPNLEEYKSSIPFYLNINSLIEDSKNKPYLKCSIIAKLFNYSISSLPLTSVFVWCKKCNYINLTPFHLASIHHLGYLNKILKCSESSIDSIHSQEQEQQEQQQQDCEELMLKRAKNFSLDWLKNVLPSEFHTIQHTQSLSQEIETEPCVSYKYSCPRCDLNSARTSQHDDVLDELNLDYIYRFWFVLRDADSKLDPVLIESDLAEKFLEGIKPIKFYTNQDKSHQVFKIIHKNFNKKYFFTLESHKLTINNENKIVYKIVNMHELLVN